MSDGVTNLRECLIMLGQEGVTSRQ